MFRKVFAFFQDADTYAMGNSSAARRHVTAAAGCTATWRAATTTNASTIPMAKGRPTASATTQAANAEKSARASAETEATNTTRTETAAAFGTEPNEERNIGSRRTMFISSDRTLFEFSALISSTFSASTGWARDVSREVNA